MQATATYKNKQGTTIIAPFDFQETRQDFLKKSSVFLLDAEIPGQLTVTFNDEITWQAVFKITKRGTYKENGITYPSMYIPFFQLGYKAEALPSDNTLYKKKYLTCIHPESNNYKAYSLEIINNKLVCKYGSIDEMSHGRGKKVEYNPDLYWVRYYEKLSKGYIDQSDILLDEDIVNKNAVSEPVFNHPLYKELYGYAKNKVNELLEDPMKITLRQVEECRTLWNSLGKETSLAGFNHILEKLLVLSPRKRNPLRDNINKFMAQSNADFTRIIQFEDGLISAMEGNSSSDATIQSLPILSEAGQYMKKHILDTLPDDIASRVESIYKVTDIPRREIFDLYCQKHNIHNIHQLWHGSRNENWLSIIQHGLLLNPNATITGKMFGNGIYFAPNPKKSYGYTSCNGTYWAKGTSQIGFMGLYDTAFGDPYYASSTYHAEEDFHNSGKNCLYASKGKLGLFNDEVVFYDENAVCLSYLVKIAS